MLRISESKGEDLEPMLGRDKVDSKINILSGLPIKSAIAADSLRWTNGKQFKYLGKTVTEPMLGKDTPENLSSISTSE